MDTPCRGMRDASVNQWLKALEWAEGLPIDHIVPGHGEVCGKELIGRLKGYFSGASGGYAGGWFRKACPRRRRSRTALLRSSYWAETSRGAYWVEQRRTPSAGVLRHYTTK